METKKSSRILSLDVVRGITIAGMILVNNPGTWSAIYPPLKHAKWHGCTPTDLIFPFFLFIVGIAITISLTKRKERGDDQKKLMVQIVRRGLMLFGLGLFLNLFPDFNFSDVRIPGVLQRIGIVYIVASILFLRLSIKSLAITGGAILVFYWLAMTLIPVPGVGYANLEPTTNLSAYIDSALLSGHMWSHTKVWDPEGVFSTVPAVVTAILGILAGWWVRKDNDPKTKAVWMFVAANFLLLGGYLWDGVFPMNKALWTSSYVLFAGGLALTFFTMCYWIIDVQGYKKWAKPFEVYGMNAITVFFASGIIGRLMYIIKMTDSSGAEVTLKTWIFNTFYLSWLEPVNASLLYAIVYIGIWLGLMWILYAKKIFIKV